MSKKYVVTYPQRNHVYRNCYTLVEATSLAQARAIMLRAIGYEFAFIYENEEAAGVDRFNLIPVPLSSVQMFWSRPQ